MGSRAALAYCCWPPLTALMCWTPRCYDPVGHVLAGEEHGASGARPAHSDISMPRMRRAPLCQRAAVPPASRACPCPHAGRLSRKVTVPLPDEPGREAILTVHLRRVPMASPAARAEAATTLARLTPGFSGAELADAVNEAAFLAARRGGETVALPDLTEAAQRTRCVGLELGFRRGCC